MPNLRFSPAAVLSAPPARIRLAVVLRRRCRHPEAELKASNRRPRYANDARQCSKSRAAVDRLVPRLQHQVEPDLAQLVERHGADTPARLARAAGLLQMWRPGCGF